MAFKFYEDYFDYVGDTESPIIYHRWAAISMVAGLLGRNISFPFGHGAIYPNMYTLLVGTPGARKGTALKPASNALKFVDFNKLAPQRVSPERFLIELQHINGVETLELEELGEIQLEQLNNHKPSEIYVISEEFSDFIKQGNIDFINLLTNLWDNLDEYKHPKIHGKSVLIHQPTVNIIGATTQQSIALSLPLEAIGQGFLSRFILVYGEPTGKKITFPRPPSEASKQRIAARLDDIKNNISGRLTIAADAEDVLNKVYHTYVGIDDYRFQHYHTRRFTHLLKLCTVFAAMDMVTEVQAVHVLQANTLLYATEQRMPKALGQFGKAKHADVANNIIELLKIAPTPQTPREVWRHVNHDLDKYEILIEIIKNLEAAEKIAHMTIGGKKGFVAISKQSVEWDDGLLIQSEFLTAEEQV